MTLLPWRAGPLQLLQGVRLLSAGLAGPWALGVLVIVGHVAAGVSGPCSIAALFIAATTAVLAALCHAEVSRRRHASMYESARDVLGVRAALVLGWASAAWRVAALAACGRGLGATMDYISGGRVRTTVNKWLTRVLSIHPAMSIDPLAAGATALTALLFILGLERSRALRLLLNLSVTFAVLFFVLVGATHCESDMWSTHAFLPAGTAGLVTGAALCSGGFLGVTAVRAESAKSWAHTAPPSSTRSRRSTLGSSGPSRHCELVACIAVILTAAASYLAVTAVLTMMVNFRALGSDAPTLVQAFEVRDVDWARLVMSTLGISALSIALVELAQPLHRLVRALAADGMLPRDLARDWAFTGTPAAAISICGVCASLLALIAPLTSLLHLTAAGALFVNTVVSALSVLLRFQPDPDQLATNNSEGSTAPTQTRLTVQGVRERLGAIPAAVRRAGEACRWKPSPQHEEEEAAPLMTIEETNSEDVQAQHEHERSRESMSSDLSGYETDSSTCSTDIDAVVAEFKEKIKVATLSDYTPRCAAPDTVTSRRASLALGGALCTGTIACVTTLLVLELGASTGSLLLLALMSLMTVALLGLAAKQPQQGSRGYRDMTEVSFRVPLAPWLPACTVLLHITLLLQLLLVAWLTIIITAASGLIAFAIREWRLARRRGVALRRRGERIHLHSPPLHPLVPTLVPSHRRLPRHSQRRFTQVDTILISR